MAVRIVPSQVCISGWNTQFPLSRPSSFISGGARVGTPCWHRVRNLRVECLSRDSVAVSEAPQKKQRRKKPLQAGSSIAVEDERGDLQLTEPAEESTAHQLPSGSDDEVLQPADDRIAQELAAMTGTISISDHVPVALRSLCVGIDPDLSGAIAVLRTEDNVITAEVIDVPFVTVTVNKKSRRRHDYQSIANLVRELQAPEGSIAYVEQAMPFPKDGKQGWYITGYGYGVWLGILAAAGFKVIPVQARVWKTAMKICGKDFTKDDSRALASYIFPDLSLRLKRKKDHGRAEALLIAAFGKGMALTHLPPQEITPNVVEL
ncbi:hypothetical protein AXG93_406s1720 [Marchantia polymorpha subsp. ruderalis]|nr:hypothetical protein AXG93_406s1720 [Marchantia polymorpha subsp. ruderalis]